MSLNSDNSIETDRDSDETTASEEVFYDLAVIGAGIAAEYSAKYLVKTPLRTSERSGYQFVLEMLEDDTTCHEQFRMETHVFNMLCDTLRGYGLERTRSTPVEEMVGLFLYICARGLDNRFAQGTFQHSGETVNRHFHRVLQCVCKMAIDWIKPIDPEFKEIPSFIKEDERYWPHFKDCVGAIDGTLVPCVVHGTNKAAYIGRKGNTSQNVMAVCDFNM